MPSRGQRLAYPHYPDFSALGLAFCLQKATNGAARTSESRIKALEQQLLRLVKLPDAVHAVSSAEGLLNIPALRSAIQCTALDRGLFPELGSQVPRMYDQVRALVRERRQQLPYCALEDLVATIVEQLGLDDQEGDAGARVRQAIEFLHDVGELAHYREAAELSKVVFLSLQWLVDVNKLVIRHDHSDSLVYDEAAETLMSATQFGAMKADFVKRGWLSLPLLRRLWWGLQLPKDDNDAMFGRLIAMLQQFGVAMPAQDRQQGPCLLVPAFFPDYLPPRSWAPQCPKEHVEVQRLFAFSEMSPAGLMQRLQVDLQSQWAAEIGVTQVLAKEGAVLALCGCRVLFKLSEWAGGEGLLVVGRGKGGGDGDGVAKLWSVMRRAVAVVQALMAQWPGIAVTEYAQWVMPSGHVERWCVSELEELRQRGEASVPSMGTVEGDDDADLYRGDNGELGVQEQQEEVPLDRLLGPQLSAAEVNAQQSTAESDSLPAPLLSHAQRSVSLGRHLVADGCDDVTPGVAESAGAAEDEMYRRLTELLRRHGIKWVMLTYCWGTPDEAGAFPMQEMVVRVYKELVGRCIPVWMDIMGGMIANTNAAMSEAVQGAAVVMPVLTAEYEGSHDCKKEINYADAKRKPLVPIVAQRGYEPSGEVGLIVAGLLWTAIVPDMKDEELKAGVDVLERELRAKGVRSFPDEFLSASQLDEGREQEQRLLKDQEQEQQRKPKKKKKKKKSKTGGEKGKQAQDCKQPEARAVGHEQNEGDRIDGQKPDEDAGDDDDDGAGPEAVEDEAVEDEAEEAQQTVKQWLTALSINEEDATKYAAALSEIGVDAVAHLYSLETADLRDINMKTIHVRLVGRQIRSGNVIGPAEDVQESKQ